MFNLPTYISTGQLPNIRQACIPVDTEVHSDRIAGVDNTDTLRLGLGLRSLQDT